LADIADAIQNNDLLSIFMKRHLLNIPSIFGLVLVQMSIASAADPADEWDASQTTAGLGHQYSVHLGIGGLYQPKYPGAGDYLLSPYPIIVFDRLYVPGVGQVVDGKEIVRGFGIYPSFSFKGKRKASDSSDLTGTNTIDPAVEIGLGLRYRYDWLRGFVEFRQGFGGHNGQVGRVGLEVITKPTDQLKLVFGPRLDWGSSDYMETYFGVTPSEAAASGGGLTAYKPDAGISSIGFDITASYSYTEKTTLHLRAGWDRFVGDADDSAIVNNGDHDNFTIGAGVSYRLDFDVFR